MTTPIALRTALALLALTASTVEAQDVRQESLERSAREFVLGARSAAARADWATLRPMFPSGPWATTVEGIVARQDTDAYSFWRKDAQLIDSLQVQVVAPDMVAVGTAFSIAGHEALWGAVLICREDRWQFHCTTEFFGSRNRSQKPGCVSPGP